MKKFSLRALGPLLGVSLSGCAMSGLAPLEPGAQLQHTFDYSVPGRTKAQLWRSARDFLATSYGDSREVLRVADEADGTLIGRGITSWTLLSSRCLSEYHIRFAAKDDKARLQLELIKGAPVGSECIGWDLPSKNGYTEVLANFRALSAGLEKALTGDGAATAFKDF